MLYPKYCEICARHKVNPTNVIADGNIADILYRDNGNNLEFHLNLLDQYLTVYYHKGKPAKM